MTLDSATSAAGRHIDSTTPVRPVLVLTAGSIALVQRVGALAYTTLQQLALSSQLTEPGWMAPINVRDIAREIGVTKDTAARAVAALVREGLVIRDRLETTHSGRRSGYVLRLPVSMGLIHCPDEKDGQRSRTGRGREGEYDWPAEYLEREHTAQTIESRSRNPLQASPTSDTRVNSRPGRDPDLTSGPSGDQPGLFDLKAADPVVASQGRTGESRWPAAR